MNLSGVMQDISQKIPLICIRRPILSLHIVSSGKLEFIVQVSISSHLFAQSKETYYNLVQDLHLISFMSLCLGKQCLKPTTHLEITVKHWQMSCSAIGSRLLEDINCDDSSDGLVTSQYCANAVPFPHILGENAFIHTAEHIQDWFHEHQWAIIFLP